jgi:hypothetical protein
MAGSGTSGRWARRDCPFPGIGPELPGIRFGSGGVNGRDGWPSAIGSGAVLAGACGALLADTGPADTGLADTGLADTGPAAGSDAP